MMIKEPRSGSVVMVLGKNKDNNNNYLLAWPKSDLLRLLNFRRKIDEILVNRIISVLTSGKCTNHSLCYKPFEEYESFVNYANLIFGVTKNEKFDFWNVNRLILKNNWHFIVGLASNKIEIVTEVFNLMGIYGIKQYSELVAAYNFGEENLCRDL